MERDELRYAIWLNPDVLSSEIFMPIMADLRERCNGPTFAPHLTLVSGITGDEREICATFESCAEQQAAFSLNPVQVRVSGDFFRAITVQSELPPVLRQFRHIIAQRFCLSVSKPYYPHLSLAYGEISDNILASIENELVQHVWPPISIESVSLWRLRGPVNNWRQVTTASLTG